MKTIKTTIDGKKYEVRLLSVDEWDAMMDDLGESNLLWHWDKMFSWCSEQNKEGGSFHAICGYHSARCFGWLGSSNRYVHCGFRPVVESLDNDTVDADNSRLNALEDGSIVRLGSLYLDGKAQRTPWCSVWDGDIPVYNGKAEICIGDTDPDPAKQIRWVKWNGLLVADRNILCNVSWDDIQQVVG